ncbi:MAG: tripartite tricarboxylate transporter permease [Methanomicrobiales archaeon]|jgi:putative membrane protein|nr:tripartite tricarboxylate transporter permease [Methanomicrobiales archaeon]
MLTGIGLGCISGITPGIHANTIAALMVSVYGTLLIHCGPEFVAAALIATLIAHSFLDIIPAAFIGIPDADTAYAVLPAHAMTRAGHGEEAVRISALGSLWGVIFAVPISFAGLLFLPALQPLLDYWIGIILVLIMGLIIVLSSAPFYAAMTFCGSGILGLFAFAYAPLAQGMIPGAGSVLMPLLTGLFGISVLINTGDAPIPKQKFQGIKLTNTAIIASSIPGTAAGILVGWLPGLSNATANALLLFRRSKSGYREYIVATSAANTANAVIGIAAFFAISRMRNGVMVALSALEDAIPPFSSLTLVAVMSSGGAFLLTILMARSAQVLNRIPAQAFSQIICVGMVALTYMLTDWFGLWILVLSILIGLLPGLFGVERMFCMGAISLPVILFALGF